MPISQSRKLRPKEGPSLSAYLPSSLPFKLLPFQPGRPWRCPKASHLPFPVGPSSLGAGGGGRVGWPWRPRRALALRAVKASLVLLALLANACHPIERPQPVGNGSLGAIVLIRRYDCTFDLKVLHAQQAGFKAAIVHNVFSDDLVRMAHVYEDLRHQISIPAVFVSEAASQDLRVIMCCDKSAQVLLLPNYPPCPDLDCHPVLAISWVLGRTLALLMSTFFILRHLWNWLWSRWAYGPAAVKKPACRRAQVRTFTRLNDVCAICLDEYQEGEQLKILPCSHTYHCKCIDPWFSQAAQRSCPVCKQSVASTTEDSSDSTIDSFCDEDPALLGHHAPIWAIQARLRSRRLALLALAS
ncbi:PREDICTED: LOW QUALITY PROTEIN: zinc/RING finger protein 4, partial [Myotis brandtii]|uniref:LOW QUALITY PROTEIN: zinc/RING finger protein 4 n=1 Tax=Myotis brandtii TaxID=109478 RepID=UPI00070435CC